MFYRFAIGLVAGYLAVLLTMYALGLPPHVVLVFPFFTFMGIILLWPLVLPGVVIVLLLWAIFKPPIGSRLSTALGVLAGLGLGFAGFVALAVATCVGATC